MSNSWEEMLQGCDHDPHCTCSFFDVIHGALLTVLKNPPPFKASVLNTEQAYFNDHGSDHLERVTLNFIKIINLKPDLKLLCCEKYMAVLAAWLHDMGLFLGRQQDETAAQAREHHHERVKAVMDTLVIKHSIPQFPLFIDSMLPMLCSGHSRKTRIDDVTEQAPFGTDMIRVRLLSAILRVADAMDVDNRRAPEFLYDLYSDLMPEDSKNHWLKHSRITGVSLNRFSSSIELFVDLSGDLAELFHQFRLAAQVARDLQRELDSVSGTLHSYGIPLNYVVLKDKEGHKIDPETRVFSSELHVNMKEEDITDDYLASLEKLLVANSGSVPFFLEIELEKGGRMTILLPNKYNVTYTDKLHNEIEGIRETLYINYKTDVESRRVIR